MRQLRLALSFFCLLWMGMILPGHTRGAIPLYPQVHRCCHRAHSPSDAKPPPCALCVLLLANMPPPPDPPLRLECFGRLLARSIPGPPIVHPTIRFWTAHGSRAPPAPSEL